MSLSLVYDPVLSRVRIAGATYLNANPYFEVDALNWTGVGGTFVRSTAQSHQGVASGLLTPDGVTASVEARAELVPATVGTVYRTSCWVRCATARSVSVGIRWHTAGSVFISTSSAAVSVAANTWTLLDVTATAPATTGQAQIVTFMTGTPPITDLLYIDEAMIETSPVAVERSTNQVTWVTVRGGASLPSGAIALDDYEFAPDVLNYYRVTGQTAASITPTLGGVWLKSIARPFLNRQVTVKDYSDVERPSRAGLFDVVGRSFPVAVHDVRGSRRWTLEVLTQTLAEASNVDLVLASGDLLFVHVPTDCPVPGGYVTVGDTSEARTQRTSVRRIFNLPCIEVAAPGPDVVGAAVNWQSVLNSYATWQDVLDAHTTWESVLELIGSPTDVVVL